MLEEKKENKEKTLRSTVGNIVYSIKPLLLFENTCGIFRFSMADTGIGKVNKNMKLVGALLASCTTAVILYKETKIHTLQQDENKLQALVDVIEEIPTLVVLIQFIAAIISTVFFLDELTISILSSFAELDTTLRVNLNEHFYSKCRSNTTKSLILLVLVHSTVAISDMASDDDFDPFKIVSMNLYFIQDLEIYAFCKMVLMLKSRLKIVNDYLEKFIYEKDTNKTPIFIVNEKEASHNKQFNFIGRISPSNMRIRDLAATYDTIGNTCHLINDVFKFQIFMNLVSTFVFILITIWTSLFYFRTPGSTYGPLMTAMSWCLVTVVSVAVMSFTCESVLTARNHTKILVNEIIMDYDLPRIMRVQAKVFMELIEAWPLRIFVYDMFAVDIKLMLKFVSVATTYLIVIIQISHFV
ncbi:hypothetical protein O0L34_g5416 [Tuta absoluta]|nr:hypothetical protein O0L34_g5416 [Tuta absoluta]